jgi:hypothetical protein
MFFLGLTRIEKKARRWEKMGVPRGGEAISKVKRGKKNTFQSEHPSDPSTPSSPPSFLSPITDQGIFACW